MMTSTVYTIGHSTRSLSEFLDLLHEAHISELVDVRRLPGSRKYPHFNQDALQDALSAEQIHYRRIEPLTGRRKVSSTVPFEVNAWWENRSFHNYADHALSAEFSAGLHDLITDAQTYTPAIMCSEAIWWRCHRRIIADHLLAHDIDVHHIMGPGNVTPANLSAGAHVTNQEVTYPPENAPD